MDLESLLVPHDDVRWSVAIYDVATQTPLAAISPDLMLPTASIAKVHLLVEVAAQIVTGGIDPHQPLDRRVVSPVGDSGLWQYLSIDVLPAIDVARMVGALSDNLGTNVLLDLVSLEAVQRRSASLAPCGSTLHDRVRNLRGPDQPPTLSEGTASDWAVFFAALGTGAVVDRDVSALVLDWLRPSADLSMVASVFGLDPLAHADTANRGLRLWNKTGTDAGVRADVGLVEAGSNRISYAVLSHWDQSAGDRRDEVLLAMRRIGDALRGELSGKGGRRWTYS